MKRRHLLLLPILLSAPLSMSFTVTFGSIAVSKVHGDPLIANRRQDLVFTIDHKGDSRNIFDFVFEIKESKTVTYQFKQSYFKVPNGIYEVEVSVPGSVLKLDTSLRFEARCERTYSGGGYIRYSSISFTQIPKSSGATYQADGESRLYNLQSLYYPSRTVYLNSSYAFRNVQKKRDVNSRRLRLEDITFSVYNLKEYDPVKEQLGELRIFTKPDYWNIGEKSSSGGKHISLPLGYTLDEGVYSLRLLNTYSFSEKTGEMMKLTEGYPQTNDLILPYWATESNPLQLQIALLNFNPAEESFLFEKEAYYEGGGALSNYCIQWEEL